MPSQFPGSNELVNSNATAKYCIQHIFAVVSLVLRITTSCKEKYYLFTHFHTFQKFHPSFFHFKRKKPISSRKLLQFLVSLPMERTCKQQYNCKVFIFNTICCCFIRELQLLARENIYLIMHFNFFPVSSSFFQFLPLQVEETYFFRDGLNRGLIRFLPPGGRNLPTLVLTKCSVHENHRTCRTFPMARPKCLMRDFTNLNEIYNMYKAHQTNVWWTMKVFRLHCKWWN